MNIQQVPYHQQPLPGPSGILAANQPLSNSPAASIYDVIIQKCSCLAVACSGSLLVWTIEKAVGRRAGLVEKEGATGESPTFSFSLPDPARS